MTPHLTKWLLSTQGHPLPYNPLSVLPGSLYASRTTTVIKSLDTPKRLLTAGSRVLIKSQAFRRDHLQPLPTSLIRRTHMTSTPSASLSYRIVLSTASRSFSVTTLNIRSVTAYHPVSMLLSRSSNGLSIPALMATYMPTSLTCMVTR